MSERHGFQNDPKPSDILLVCEAYAEFLEALLHIDKSFDHLKSTKKVSTQVILGVNEIRMKMRDFESMFEKEFDSEKQHQKQNKIASVSHNPENADRSLENSFRSETTLKKYKKEDYPFGRKDASEKVQDKLPNGNDRPLSFFSSSQQT